MAYDNTSGTFPNFGFTAAQTFGPGGIIPMSRQGSMAGVPPPQGAQNMVESGASIGGPAADLQYGQSKAGTPAHNQPIWWSVAIFGLAVVMLGHVAHIGLKR